MISLILVLVFSLMFGISAHAISALCVEEHFEMLQHINVKTNTNKTLTPPSAESCSYTATKYSE